MDVHYMKFNGKLLKRGFWVYIWDIKSDNERRLHVGRTGDSSSHNASSPFRRIGQHLEMKLSAKGNALGKCLRNAGIEAESCIFEMTALGPIFDEQDSFEKHVPFRDRTATLERALADELRKRGYKILGAHPRASKADPDLLKQLISAIETYFQPYLH